MKLGERLRFYPKNVSPRDLTLKISIAREFRDEIKRDGVFSRTQEIEFERASDSRGFRTGLEAGNHSKELVASSQSCAPKTKPKSITNGHKNDEIESIQKPRGHEEDRASFPNQIPHKVSTIHQLNLP